MRSTVDGDVILIDLDLFGRFNKRYGHVIGDKVLQSVANV